MISRAFGNEDGNVKRSDLFAICRAYSVSTSYCICAALSIGRRNFVNVGDNDSGEEILILIPG
jgi:hypothetical protein